MTDTWSFNPCFCTTIRCGCVIISIFDIVYGLVYLGRYAIMEQVIDDYPEYYDRGNFNDTKFSDLLNSRANYADYSLTSLSGVILFVGVMYLPLYWTWVTCYVWLAFRAVLTFCMSPLCHYMIHSDNTLYKNYGAEVLMSLLLHAYMAGVVYMYSKEAKEEYRNNLIPVPFEGDDSDVRKTLTPIPRHTRDIQGLYLYEVDPSSHSTTHHPNLTKIVKMISSTKNASVDSRDEDPYRQYLGHPSTSSVQIASNSMKTIAPTRSVYQRDFTKEIHGSVTNSELSVVETENSSSFSIQQEEPKRTIKFSK